MVSGKSTLTVKFPDRLFSHVSIDEKERSFSMYYDGKKLSLYGENSKSYAVPTLLSHQLVKKSWIKLNQENFASMSLWKKDQQNNFV